MTTWSQLFAGTLPNPTPADVGKALMVRAGPAWVADFLQFDDVQGVRTRLAQINLSGAAPPAPPPGSTVLQGVGAAGSVAAIDLVGVGNVARYTGRQSRGTPGVPSATQKGDALASYGASGYGATGWGAISLTGQIFFAASEDFTDTAKGTELRVQTTPLLATGPVVSWVFGSEGHLVPFVNNTFDLGSATLQLRNLWVSTAHITSALVVPSLWVGPNPQPLVLTADASYSSVVFNNNAPQSILQYDIAAKVLSYYVGGTNLLNIDSVGNLNLKGSFSAQGVGNFGPGAELQLAVNPSVSTRLFMERASTSYWQWSYARSALEWYPNNAAVPAFIIDATGTHVNVLTASQVNIGPIPAKFQLSADANASNIIFDTTAPISYFQYAIAAKTLQYVVNNATAFSVGPDGSGLFSGSLRVGRGALFGSDATYSTFYYDFASTKKAYWQYAVATGGLIYVYDGVARFTIDGVGNTTAAAAVFSTTWVYGRAGVAIGQNAKFQLVTDESTYAQITWDQLGNFTRYHIGNKTIYDYINNTEVRRTDINGNTVIPAGSYAAGFYVTGAASPYYLSRDATYSNMTFDGTAWSYLQYSIPNKTLNFVLNNVSQATLGADGNLAARGYVIGSRVQLNVADAPAIQSDGAIYSDFVWNNAKGTLMRCNIGSGNGDLQIFQGSIARHTFAATGVMYSTQQHVAAAFYAGSAARCALWTDNSGLAAVYFDVTNAFYLQINWTTGHLIYYAHGVPVFSIDPNGNVAAKGAITPNATPSMFAAMGAETSPSIEKVTVFEASSERLALPAPFEPPPFPEIVHPALPAPLDMASGDVGEVASAPLLEDA